MGAWWRIGHSIYLSPTEEYRSNYLMYTAGDTMVGGYLCQKIVKTADSVCYRTGGCQGFADSSAYAYWGNIYQDSLGKVYSAWPNGQLNLMYDFGAQPGAFVYTFSGPTYEIDSVSSVMYTDGILRRKQHVKVWLGQPSPSHTVLVEGIGDISRGLFPGPYEYEGQNGLACFDEGAVPVSVAVQEHCSPTYDCMQLQLAAAEMTEAGRLEIFPNPSADGAWHIADSEHRFAAGCHAVLSDLSGRTVQERDFAGSASITLQFDGPPGLYMLRLQFSKGEQASAILVRN